MLENEVIRDVLRKKTVGAPARRALVCQMIDKGQQPRKTGLSGRVESFGSRRLRAAIGYGEPQTAAQEASARSMRFASTIRAKPSHPFSTLISTIRVRRRCPWVSAPGKTEGGSGQNTE